MTSVFQSLIIHDWPMVRRNSSITSKSRPSDCIGPISTKTCHSVGWPKGITDKSKRNSRSAYGMDLSANFNSIHQRIALSCDRANRDASSITVVAVSKNRTPEDVRAAAECGVNLFGENRVQEAKAKISMC